ncbi:MAG: acyl-CoA thioesterase [Planctomycetaceae bacterium]
MQNYKLVLPENLNHFGYLFGGYLLQWVDEVAWIAASLEYPGCKFVTIGMDKVEFHESILEGTILKFDVNRIREGTTSASYLVEVAKEGNEQGSAFTTTVTMVRVDAEGNKTPLSGPADYEQPS